jgi:hypothetical protein
MPTLPPSEQVIEQIQTSLMAHADFFLRVNAEYTARMISYTTRRRHHCGRQG